MLPLGYRNPKYVSANFYINNVVDVHLSSVDIKVRVKLMPSPGGKVASQKFSDWKRLGNISTIVLIRY